MSQSKTESSDLHILTEESINLRNIWTKKVKSRDQVPPHTPNSEYSFDGSFYSLPEFPDVEKLEIPFVRDKGVKFCIETFGIYFNCNNYEFDLLQFWFLDVITDCVWISQDEFRLPVKLQKTVLTWVLYFINLLRDPQRNITRKRFFAIFKEAILVAAEILSEGCGEIPAPNRIFRIMQAEDDDTRRWSSSDSESTGSSISIDQSDFDNASWIELAGNKVSKVYELPKEACTCDDYDLSTNDSTTKTCSAPSSEDVVQADERSQCFEFYKPDLSTPPRFLPLAEEVEKEVIKKTLPSCKIDVYDIEIEDEFDVYESTDKYEISLGSASTTSNKQSTESTNNVTTPLLQKIPPSATNEKEILKGLAIQKMWEQRMLDMDDPDVGWMPYEEDSEDEPQSNASNSRENETEDDDNEWINIMKRHQKKMTEMEDNQIVNFGVLWAIIDFIFKYFYESYQFSLIKLALQTTPGTITQRLNDDWMIPKRTKVELQRPKAEMPKKEAKPKSEKPPKEARRSKESKSKSEKSEQVKQKPAEKQKPHSPTREEKEEMARQRKELERLEQERLKMEENKRYVFPLAEAANDELFMGIFENWTKGGSSKSKK